MEEWVLGQELRDARLSSNFIPWGFFEHSNLVLGGFGAWVKPKSCCVGVEGEGYS